MKKFFFFILFISTTTLLQAQLPWKIRLGNKTVLQTSGEDQAKNIIRLTIKQIGAGNKLILSYKIPADEKDWIRELHFDDTTGSGIIESPELTQVKKSKTEVCYSVSNKKLKEILSRHRKILIYFTSIPSDPEKAAIVRVRPVHICTLILR